MRILLIHPEDQLLDRPWVPLRWDRIIDLGRAGAKSYGHAAARFGCPVTPIDDLRVDFKEIRKVRELFTLGMGRLRDRVGLDWWELTSILVHQQLERVILLLKFAETLGPLDEVYLSRPSFQAEALRLVLGAQLHVFSRQGGLLKRGAGHYLRTLKKFPMRQLLDIFWDKTDPGYQLRGPASLKREPSATPFVLLPTAYINASKTGISYAKVLPEKDFLLLATRRSGWIETPSNVSRAWLRSYYSSERAARKQEWLDLMDRWQALRDELEGVAEFEILSHVGYFDDFPERFARGLEIRDAWRNVLEREPVQSVLCADDSNPYTHIPLILAAQKKLPTINCHHGALDGRYMFKSSHADVILTKGKMEQDYLVRVCGMSADQVEVGAPAAPPAQKDKTDANSKSAIVFFSEVYEVGGGRAKDFYQDVLPRLADLAISEGKELIVKLHPSESVAERTRIVNQALGPDRCRVTRIVDGGMTDDLWNRLWFGVTVLSTVGVECTLRGVPCLLCGWLEAWPYGYVEQFSRFGAGIRLKSVDEIVKIPTLVRDFKPSPTVEKDFANRIEAARLQELLARRATSETASALQNRVASS